MKLTKEFTRPIITVRPICQLPIEGQTTGGQSYTSAAVVDQAISNINSVVWRPEAAGTRFYVSGHDPSGSTIFYRYVFTETWGIPRSSLFVLEEEGGLPVFHDPNTEQVFTCWRTVSSTEVLTASTKQLSKDIVSMFPVG